MTNEQLSAIEARHIYEGVATPTQTYLDVTALVEEVKRQSEVTKALALQACEATDKLVNLRTAVQAALGCKDIAKMINVLRKALEARNG